MISIFFPSERNLNPKAACLKRREEEKTEELPGRGGLSADDLVSQQAGIAGKVRNLLLPFPTQFDDDDDMDSFIG